MPSRRNRRVGLVFSHRYLTHNAGQFLIGYRDPYPFAEPVPHVSSPAIAGRTKQLLDFFNLSNAMLNIQPEMIGDGTLRLYHTPVHPARQGSQQHGRRYGQWRADGQHAN